MAKVNYEKAWQKLKEEKMREYIRLYEGIEGFFAFDKMQILSSDLTEMDKLDGTKEFSNLLDDMNREDKWLNLK